MTIVAGFTGWNCIVLAADTEETIGVHLKLSAPKLQPAIKEKWRAIIGGAGNGHLIDRFAEKVDGIDGALSRAGEFKEAIEQILQDIFATYIYSAPAASQDDLEIAVVVGVWTEADGLALIESSGTSTIFSRRGFSFVGVGESHARKLADQWYSRNRAEESLVLLANYILRQTKRYEPYCGGDTQMLSLNSSGGVTVHAPERSRDDEDYSDLFDLLIQYPFFVCADERATKEQIQACTELMQMLNDLRKGQKTNRALSEARKAEFISRLTSMALGQMDNSQAK